jgi:TRAP-type mannitol/chloroaromatic compound transport system permease large subunit
MSGREGRRGAFLLFWLAFLILIGLITVFYGAAGLQNFMLAALALALLFLLIRPNLGRTYVEAVFRFSLTAMVFIILLAARAFVLVFTPMGGAAMVRRLPESMTGGQTGSLLIVFFIIFVLGFFLDTF